MGSISKWTARAAAGAAILALVAAAGEAQNLIDIGVDQIRVEGNATTLVPFTLTLAGPATSTITVNWRTIGGSAQVGFDFVLVTSGTVTFNPGDLSKPLTPTVQIVGDSSPEWSSTLQQDEVFFVELFNPIGATIRRGRASVTIIDDDVSQPGAQYLSAVTDSTGKGSNDGRNRLQWRVPAAPSGPTRFNVCFKTSATTCTPPLADTDIAGGGCFNVPGPFTPGSKMLFTHDKSSAIRVRVGNNYCYTVFTYYPAVSNERAEVSVKAFNSGPGPVRWTLTPGHYGGTAAASLVPPTVGLDGIYSVGTDGVVYAMQRGASGGLWPSTWNPLALGKPAHSRSPVVTFSAGARFFAGTENGEVHAVDARLGTLVWSRAAVFPPGSQQLMTGATGAQAAPAGIFKSFGGLNDLLVVGTATAVGNTSFFALDPTTGATLDSYPTVGDTPPGPIDNVLGMAVVDYATNKVYFGTNGSAFTLWGLDMGPSGAPDLKLLTTPAWNPKPLGASGGTTGSPVMRNGQLYMGTDNGANSQVHSLRASDGLLYSYTHGDGQVKGFVWPDRRDTRLYFSTVNKVHGVFDSGSSLAPIWAPISVVSPSIPLQKPGTDHLWVGDGQGRLIQIEVLTGTVTNSIPLDTGTVQIGAPSLDNPNNLLIVGSDKGVIYAVSVPF
jgi:outer membrane protein assembly factor BamB